MSECESKKLVDLRVVDLRSELEKRSLDRNGIKQILVERLKEALEREGVDPETHLFEVGDKKQATKTRQSLEDEEKTEVVSEVENPPPAVEVKEKPQETAEKVQEETKQPEEKPEVVVEATPKEAPEETLEENDGAGQESPIRLTLDEEETLHDDEAEPTVEKQSNGAIIEDAKKSNEALQADGKSNKETTPAGAEEVSKENTQASDNSGGKTTDGKNRKVSSNQNPKVVWISNVAQNTRASELKQALSVCGKVTGAKVVVNARFPGSCCFGYVTMGSVEDADNVIAKLNNTELNGQIIKIDKFDHVRAEQMKQMRSAAIKSNDGKDDKKQVAKQDKNKDEKGEKKGQGRNDDITKKVDLKDRKDSIKDDKEKNLKKVESSGADVTTTGTNAASSTSTGSKDDLRNKRDVKDGQTTRDDERRHSRASDRMSRERGRRSSSRDRRHPYRSSSPRTRHHPDVLTFDKIREERERQRLREKERLLREENRRRHEEAIRQREVERRQRSEAQRLEREREKLRMEREKIEREKAELIRMERERQRLEREKLQAEKMELERTLIRLEEDRRAIKRPAPYRGDNFDERKRAATDRHFEDEAPPPPRFDTSASIKPREPSPKKFASSKDYKARAFEAKHEPVSYPEKRGAGRDYEVERSHPPQMTRPGSTSAVNKYERSFDRERNDPRESRSDPRSREMPPNRSKDSRYINRERERERSPHFRGGDSRDARRPIQENKPEITITREKPHFGYAEASTVRFDRSSSNNWNHSSSGPKPFGSGNPNKSWPKDSWRTDTSGSERWNSSGGPSGRSTLNQPFAGNSNSMAPACPPPPGLNNYPDRFDYNKSMNSGMRKY